MTGSKLSDIDAVAFDIDGTLYPAWAFTVRCIPFFLRHIRFMHAFSAVRRFLHSKSAADPDTPIEHFYEFQNELLAQRLHMPAGTVGAFLHDEIYHGWAKTFLHIRPYPFAKESVALLKSAGLKIGILSDFPPEQKGDVWGILPFCDAAIGSESTGALKPSHIPFKKLAAALQTPCNRILYVGNSRAYDVAGAAAVGMKTACIEPPFVSLLKTKKTRADISFSTYRQFLTYVL